MARSKKGRLGTMEKLRSRLDLLRSQQLALEANSAKCPIERARKQAASQSALMQSLERSVDLAEGGDLIASVVRGVSPDRVAAVVEAQLRDVPAATVEFLGNAGEAIVVSVPTASALFRESEFWLRIATSVGPHSIGWIRFERRCVVSAKAVFEATELRSGGCEAPDQGRALQLWQYLALGGL